METSEPGATGSVFPFASTAKLAALVTPPPDTNTGAPGLMVRLIVPEVLPPALSMTPTRNLEVPVAVGVPEIVPELDNAKPLGRLPWTRTQLYGGLPPPAVRD